MQHDKVRPRSGSVGAHAIFDRDGRLFVLPERRVARAGIGRHVTVDDRDVFLAHFPLGEELFDLPYPLVAFYRQDDAAGFAVEPVDKMHGHIRTDVQAHAADEAGIDIALGGMAGEAGGFVDHQQAVVFMDDVEQLFDNA